MKLLHNLFRRIPAVMKVAQIICQSLEWTVPYIFDNIGADTFSPEEERWMLDCVRSKFGPHVQQTDLETVGCGTIGRVYRYQNYAIKIKIPGVLERIDRDLAYIEAAAKVLDVITQYSFYFYRKIHTVHESICNQNDFVLELQNGIQFEKQLGEFGVDEKYIFVPKFYPDKCTENMIVTDFVQGVTIASLKDPRAYITEPVRDELHKFLLYNLTLFPLCHTDLHVGNMILDRFTNRIAVIDFGMCNPKLDPKNMYILLRLLQAAQTRDAIAISKILSVGYFLDNNLSKCIKQYPDLYKDFEFEVVRAVHKEFEMSDLHILRECFVSAGKWCVSRNIWRAPDMAIIEIAAMVSLANALIIGFRSDTIRRYADEILKKELVD